MEKPGIKTSEFWVAIFAPILVGALQAFGIDVSEPTIIIMITPMIAYIAGRTWLKGQKPA